MSGLPGGWTPYTTKISRKALRIFKQAIANLMGVDYEPLAVATQVVAGTNYSFFCNARVVHPDAPNEAAIINVYAPLQGSPQVQQIRTITP